MVVRSKAEGRLLLRLNEKTLLEPPAGMRGILPGALVEVESRYEPGRGMIVTRIEEVLAPGGGTPVAEARALRDRGLFAEAAHALGSLADPAALATRARLALDAGGRADDEVRALLEAGEGDASEPWDVASLYASSPEESRERLRPLLGAWLARTRLPAGSPAVQRVLALAPPTAWTLEQLFARLARPDTGQREVLANAVREGRARGVEHGVLAAAERLLARLEAADDDAAARKRAHPVLRAALRVAHKRVRPPLPFHLGGPAPKLSVEDLVAAAAFCAAAAPEHERRDLEEAAEALGERPLSYHALEHAKRAASIAVRALQKEKRFDDAAALVAALDALLVEREWRALLESHRDGAPAVDRVLWRGDDGRNGLGHVLVRTDGGGLALLSKVARRWRWHTGSRDDVLATVPDTHFASAAARAR